MNLNIHIIYAPNKVYLIMIYVQLIRYISAKIQFVLVTKLNVLNVFWTIYESSYLRMACASHEYKVYSN